MKVWEKCNQLKGTTSSKEQIASWAYMNRICPTDFKWGLELEVEYPEEMSTIADKTCAESKCNHECLDKFLDSEMEQGGE